MLSTAILLGPQRHVRLVQPALDTLVPGDDRPVALVSAGWEERESEDHEFRDHIGRSVQNLEIWARVERIFERDRELLGAMRQRHDTLRRVQELYRLRLLGAMEATRELLRRPGNDLWLAAERHDALVMLQGIDSQHVARVQQVHDEFEARWRPGERAAVQRERRDLHKKLQESCCLCIAGGHIAVLLHRLRLFDVLGLHGDRPVVAWSAGAMALCERIVLFHDTPPQGSACAEVMEAGFGVLPDLVALPHAKKRLDATDERNVQLFARRFAPALCVLLDDGARVDWNGSRWSAQPDTRRLTEDGWVEEVGA
ncbi:MAG: Type 1 glutamine amidotransferase-like domain-containing protein [Planctomycetes bacterium]|nr:Type 1 glutamine amidotransferase-like domain-containing protein [Planctomycetota bacterium]